MPTDDTEKACGVHALDPLIHDDCPYCTQIRLAAKDEEISRLTTAWHAEMATEAAMRAEIERLRGALADAMVMATNGDYTNGVTDPSGCLDQGACWAGVILADLQSRCTELGVVFGPTIYDNLQRYDARAAGGEG